jgi:hypothetical protein
VIVTLLITVVPLLWLGGSTTAGMNAKIDAQRERLDRGDLEQERRGASLAKRLDDDERDTKALSKVMDSINIHLAHIDTAMDLFLKEIPVPPVTRR